MQETLSLNPIKLGVMTYTRRQRQGNQNFKVIASYIVKPEVSLSYIGPSLNERKPDCQKFKKKLS